MLSEVTQALGKEWGLILDYKLLWFDHSDIAQASFTAKDNLTISKITDICYNTVYMCTE